MNTLNCEHLVLHNRLCGHLKNHFTINYRFNGTEVEWSCCCRYSNQQQIITKYTPNREQMPNKCHFSNQMALPETNKQFDWYTAKEKTVFFLIGRIVQYSMVPYYVNYCNQHSYWLICNSLFYLYLTDWELCVPQPSKRHHNFYDDHGIDQSFVAIFFIRMEINKNKM